MKEEVEKYLEKAEASLGVARNLFDDEYYADACSKAYYVMYYSAQALLRNSDINVTKHSAVVAKFGERFAKTGKIDPKYHRYFIDAKKKREVADYDVFSIIDRNIAKEMIKWAEDFLSEIKKLAADTTLPTTS